VDGVALPQVDLVFDITKRFPVEDGDIAEVFSAATLEHQRKHSADHVLREFFRILAPGGTLHIIQPDIEAIARAITDKTIDLFTMNQFLFGKFKSDATDYFDLHKWMYPADALIAELKHLGFIDVRRMEFTPEFRALHEPEYNFCIHARKPKA
jgi:SAM-dependent methyltransferase